MQQPYELNVDHDAKLTNNLIVFVNYRMFDYQHHYIGVTGIGITVDYVQKLINQYQTRYHRNIYFVDTNGMIVLSSNQAKVLGARAQKTDGLAKLASSLTHQSNGAYEYQKDHVNYLVNVRYIPELKWYLLVEKNEAEATSSIGSTLYINLALCALVTFFVIGLTHLALKRYQTQIERLATTDSLTNLPNRTAFDVAIELMLRDSRRSKTSMSLIIADVDNFKQMNDLYGHLAGDIVLQETAKVLVSSLRETDFVCRWGGEEFLVLLKECDSQHAAEIAENIRVALEEMAISHHKHQLKITSSFGVATLLDDETIAHLISRADSGLYEAKKQGRNRVVLNEAYK